MKVKHRTKLGRSLVRFIQVVMVVCVASSAMHAQAKVTLKHKSWQPGHSGYFNTVDHSKRALICRNGRTDRDCGYVELTTGTSKCVETKVNVGLDYSFPLPAKFGSLGASAGYEKKWKICSTRGETIGCYGQKNKQVRAEILVNNSWGARSKHGSYRAVKVNLGRKCSGKGRTRRCRDEHKHTCPHGGKLNSRRAGATHKYFCDFDGSQTQHGWWPRYEAVECVAKKRF